MVGVLLGTGGDRSIAGVEGVNARRNLDWTIGADAIKGFGDLVHSPGRRKAWWASDPISFINLDMQAVTSGADIAAPVLPDNLPWS